MFFVLLEKKAKNLFKNASFCYNYKFVLYKIEL